MKPNDRMMFRNNAAEKSDYQYRALPLSERAESLNEEKRSVDVIASTENPVRIFDWDHGMVNEVLLMSGAQLPHTRKIVLLDSHDRWDTSTVLGSFQGMEIRDGQLVGTAYFAARASDQWDLVREGHLEDFSVGYRVSPDHTVFVPKDQKATVDGREWEGPVLLRTKWWPKELSLVPIGADEMAKARGESRRNQKGNSMDPRLKSYLESR